MKQNMALLDVADAFARSTGQLVLHENHWNKMAFAAHITRSYLDDLSLR